MNLLRAVYYTLVFINKAAFSPLLTTKSRIRIIITLTIPIFRDSLNLLGTTQTQSSTVTYVVKNLKEEEFLNGFIVELSSSTFMNTEKTAKNIGILLYWDFSSQIVDLSQAESLTMDQMRSHYYGPMDLASLETSQRPQQCTQPNMPRRILKIVPRPH